MQVGRSRRNGSYSQLSPEGLVNRVVAGTGEHDVFVSSSTASSSPLYSSSSSSSSSPMRLAPGVNYIEHRVSKMDTLAGVAIKYGVEVNWISSCFCGSGRRDSESHLPASKLEFLRVNLIFLPSETSLIADIRRMNALVTDRQMFAHKSLKIPSPGRHPPSPILLNGPACNGSQSPRRQPQRDLFKSFQSLKLNSPEQRVSPAMSSLMGYYGLTTPKRVPLTEGTEMAVHRTGRVICLEDEPLPRVSPISDLHPNGHHKSINLINGFSLENADSAQDIAIVETTENGGADKSNREKSVRRRQRIDADLVHRAPDWLLKEDDGPFSGRIGKGLAPRPKSGSRSDLDSSCLGTIPSGDSFMANGFLPVRKSSSTSNLQESDNNSSMWPTSKWPLKPDAIAKPLFDGLPKPMTVRRNKAALD